ncbi:hypothetical protein [Fusobacterium perfoetens]|uniref:hypothetical protein n=1 Tax=Fusobacterium perfoetens TaxID=852 RepID=UPI000486954A|nr:hypothetical protein [Fusobacterium perfoetens]
MEEIIEFLEKTKIKKYEELLSCLELQKDILDEISKELANKYISELINNKEFEKATESIEFIKEINKKSQEIEKLLDKRLELDEEIKEASEVNNLKDYDKYRVDENEKHSLYEIFRHKRPCAFIIENKRIEANSWKEVLINTCEYLGEKDSRILSKIVKEEKIKGRKRSLLSTNKKDMYGPEYLKLVDGYVETNLSADGIRNLIKKLLKEYNIQLTKYFVFLRADYTELNSDD